MKNLYTRFLLLVILLVLGGVAGSVVEANPTNILYTSAPNPVGSGARAMGMGGAFIAIADDATAASWNPAGLVQLKRPEMSVVGSFVHRKETFTTTDETQEHANASITLKELNYLSTVYPFSLWNRNMVVSLNYQRLYDYAAEHEITDSYFLLTVAHESEGCLAPIGLAYSIQITPQLKWGITVNVWDDFAGSNELKERTSMHGYYELDGVTTVKFEGVNFNMGLLWQPSEQFSFGAVFKSPFTADLEEETTSYMMGVKVETESFRTEKKLDMPSSFGFGMSYKFQDTFKVSLDLYQTNWGRYILTTEDGREYLAATGLPVSEYHVDATRQVRMGMEYLIVRPAQYLSYPLRCGIFYDPIPDEGSPVDVYGGSIGAGIATARFAIDGFYQYKFSVNDFSEIMFKEYFPDRVKEHTLYVSCILYL